MQYNTENNMYNYELLNLIQFIKITYYYLISGNESILWLVHFTENKT
jgi:hypothetical protein